jgi:hypothetical protein
MASFSCIPACKHLKASYAASGGIWSDRITFHLKYALLDYRNLKAQVAATSIDLSPSPNLIHPVGVL